VASFTIATTPRVPDGAGGWRDGETWFVRCSAWGQLGENICESLAKGAAVVASGRLRARTWEDSDGNRRAGVEMTVDNLGPSLRHHTARVVKVTRETGPAANGTAPAAGSGAVAGPAPASAADGWPDQPPF
jgi:single-strand DNA-binding protein